MSEQTQTLQKVSRLAWIIGFLGALWIAFGWSKNPTLAAASYLPAWLFFFGISVGSFALIMIHHLTLGGWGFVIRRIQETLLEAIPLCALLFIPIGLSMYHLYPWTDTAAVAHDPVLSLKTAYLNMPFFWVRFAVYFVIWIWLTTKLKKHSAIQDQNPSYATNFRLAGYGGGGLLIYSLTITFATIDWIMAVEPHWFSTMYGAIFMIAFSLSSLALSIILAVYFSHSNKNLPAGSQSPMQKVLTTDRLHDLGTLLFANDMLWAYTSISQFIIIWSANLKEEAVWYIHRSQNGWWMVIASIFVLHFLLPFLLLLMRFIKRKASRLIKVAALLLFIRYIEFVWYVKPTFIEHVRLSWMDLAAVLAVGGIWIGFIANRLAKTEVTFKLDPIYHEEQH